MLPSQQYRQQHDQISELVNSLIARLNEHALANDATAVSKTLSQLTGLLRCHLQMEDDFLYPRLRTHKDEKIRELAKQYQDEMGSLLEVYNSYFQRWITHKHIQANPVKFISETFDVIAALNTRIERENNNLYALYDKDGWQQV
jgi:hemerythrin